MACVDGGVCGGVSVGGECVSVIPDAHTETGTDSMSKVQPCGGGVDGVCVCATETDSRDLTLDEARHEKWLRWFVCLGFVCPLLWLLGAMYVFWGPYKDNKAVFRVATINLFFHTLLCIFVCVFFPVYFNA
eukprot:GDKI01028224.1.p1 GENE.GDKI01028224.1~~GDKI01028224.1.p1  ORF type:complete len:142 (-),score=58.96 GDKI01028224.1:114-506(-)